MAMFSFPDRVNENAARTVAAVVALLGVLVLAFDAHWLLAVLAAGFWARVLTGPTLSPLGRFAMWFAQTFLGEPRHVPGPPKRFAQGIGAVMTTAAALAALAFGARGVAEVLTVALVVAATLESVFGLCIGCRLFALLMRAGVVPAEVCERCVAGAPESA